MWRVMFVPRFPQEIEADRLRAMKTGSLIDPKQVTTSPSVRHSRNMVSFPSKHCA